MKLLHLMLPAIVLLAIGLTLLVVTPAACDDLQGHLPTPPKGLAWHKLYLEHANPSDVMRIMHWDNPEAPISLGVRNKESGSPAVAAMLPEGVKLMFPLQGDNALLIESTFSGFAYVRKIVQNIIIAPRQLQFKVQFVRARIADVKALGIFAAVDPLQHSAPYGAKVATALESLIANGSEVLETHTFRTSEDGGVSFPCRTSSLSAPSGPPSSARLITNLLMEASSDAMKAREIWITITLYVNQDDTIILTLTSKGGDQDREFGGRVRTVGLPTRYQSGDILVMGGLLTGRQTELLVFITPTLLPQESNAGNESGQKRGMIQGTLKVSVAP